MRARRTQDQMRRRSASSGDRAPRVVSMFAGCGGMDLGFRQAGFRIAWANELNEDAVRTYRRNLCCLSQNHLLEGDIASLDPPRELVGNTDVLLGGFPCQAFSNAGSRKGVNDDRGLLYKHCIRFIATLKPEFVVFENVRGILTIPGRKKRFVEEVCDELSALGYHVQIALVNASFYGVPQNRLRVVIVGERTNKNREPRFRFPLPHAPSDLTLASILDVPADAPNQQDVIQLNPQAYAIGRHVPEGGSWKDVPSRYLPERLVRIRKDMERYHWPNFYRRFARTEIAGTVTAAFKPENAGVWHPVENRALSVREVARIQSFPEDFIFEARSVKAMYQMIGNAVPPQMAQAIASAIKRTISGEQAPTPLLSYQAIRSSGDVIRPLAQGMVYRPTNRDQNFLPDLVA